MYSLYMYPTWTSFHANRGTSVFCILWLDGCVEVQSRLSGIGKMPFYIISLPCLTLFYAGARHSRHLANSS